MEKVVGEKHLSPESNFLDLYIIH